jgi:hypothetical protein
MAKNLTVQNLDFDEIKENLITFLKSQSKFTEYDFRGSGFDVLMDLLSYNTHYMGYYAHMLANESFVDSAMLKSSLTSKAKLLNYIPRGKTSSTAEVILKIPNLTSHPTGNKVLFERGNIALASKKENELNGDGRNFILIDDLYVYNKPIPGGNEYHYESEIVDIYEGSYKDEMYKVDSSIYNQRFILHDSTVDYNTIRVKVYTDNSLSDFVSYKLANDFTEINGESVVFFLTVNENEFYELRFGNGVYGKPVEDGNIIKIEYVSTSGEVGNNAKHFIYNGVYNSSDVEITTISNSDGGKDEDDIEDLKFNIPNHYKRQNRLVTIDDYKNILLSEYGNISSINVWGGEDNYPIEYGKVFISIKPKFGDVLTTNAKARILNDILKKYSVVTVEGVIVDADYLYVDLYNTTKFNPNKTDKTAGEIQSFIQEVVQDYNDGKVSKFDGYFSNSRLNKEILLSDKSIISTFNHIRIKKRLTPTINTVQQYVVDFNNKLDESSLLSTNFIFRGYLSRYEDNGKGFVLIYRQNPNTMEWETYADETFGLINYETGIISLSDISIEEVPENKGDLLFTATPVEPDFYPVRNNIVKIDTVKYTVIEDAESNA